MSKITSRKHSNWTDPSPARRCDSTLFTSLGLHNNNAFVCFSIQFSLLQPSCCSPLSEPISWRRTISAYNYKVQVLTTQNVLKRDGLCSADGLTGQSYRVMLLSLKWKEKPIKALLAMLSTGARVCRAQCAKWVAAHKRKTKTEAVSSWFALSSNHQKKII